MIDVSVLIAAYRSRAFIGAAIGSALAQDVALEIVVAPDEPGDYRSLAALDPRIRVLDGVAAPTGPGAARNRALAAARGHFIAVLDDDDLWSPDYLARLLPLAQDNGLAFGSTHITDWAGEIIRAVRFPAGRVDYGTFETAFASLHAVLRRDAARQWLPVLAEDVLFDLESLALAGGRAPCDDAAVYFLRQRPASLTQGTAFIRDIAAAYERLLALVETGGTRIPPPERAAAAAVFRTWARMNAGFEAALARNPALTYQSFVRTALGEAPD